MQRVACHLVMLILEVDIEKRDYLGARSTLHSGPKSAGECCRLRAEWRCCCSVASGDVEELKKEKRDYLGLDPRYIVDRRVQESAVDCG
jgi:hypothetical protein